MNYKIIDGEKVYGYRWIILALMGLACIVVNGSTLVFAGMAGILLNPTGPWAFDAQQFMLLTSAWQSPRSAPSCVSSGEGSPACS